jgi:hypothetical protein
MRPTPALFLALALAGCDAPEATGAWSLVGLYDGAALARLDGPASGGGYTWQADPGVEDWCGRAKGPLGLGGAMDAELMARGRVPYLVAVVAGPADEALTTADLSLFVSRRGDAEAGEDQQSAAGRQPLAPAVVPRRLEVSVLQDATVDPDGVREMTRQLQAQLTVQLCLEHQAGRAWTGVADDPARRASTNPMQNIFMLDEVQDETRRIFVGQGAAAAPLLGPPVWTPQWRPSSNEPAVVTGRSLRSADLFAFRSPASRPHHDPLPPTLSPAREWPERFVTLAGGGVACPSCAWTPAPPNAVTELVLTVTELGLGDQTPQPLGLSARWRTRRGAADSDEGWHDWSAGEVKPIPGDSDAEGQELKALPDVLGAVPYEYPRLLARPDGGPERAREPSTDQALTVLVVPNWQLVNAWRFVETARPDPLESLGPDPVDGVGWILEHPELLGIQKLDGAPDDGGERRALSLSASLHGERSGALDWLPRPRFGATPDFRARSAPVAVLGVGEVSSHMQRLATRSGLDHLVLVALIVLSMILLPGLSRVPNLWSARPRERAWGWPSRKRRGLTEAVKRASESAEGS